MREWGLVKSILMLVIASAFVAAGISILWKADTGDDVLLGLGGLAFFGSMIPFSLLKLLTAVGGTRGAPADTPGAPRIFQRPMREVVALTFMVLGVGIGCFLLGRLESANAKFQFATWFGVAVFGLGLLIPFMAVYRPMRLSLTSRGIEYSLFKCGPIEWSDIVAIHTGYFMRSEYVGLEVMDPEKYYARGFARGGRASRWLAGRFSSPFVIIPQQIGASAQAVVDAINLWAPVSSGSSVTAAPDPGGRREPRF